MHRAKRKEKKLEKLLDRINRIDMIYILFFRKKNKMVSSFKKIIQIM